MQLHNMYQLNNEPTCFQSHNLNCIDNILENRKTLFKTSKIFEIGLSDHHKLVSAIMTSGSFRDPLRKKICRYCQNFNLQCFNIALKTELLLILPF